MLPADKNGDGRSDDADKRDAADDVKPRRTRVMLWLCTDTSLWRINEYRNE